MEWLRFDDQTKNPFFLNFNSKIPVLKILIRNELIGIESFCVKMKVTTWNRIVSSDNWLDRVDALLHLQYKQLRCLRTMEKIYRSNGIKQYTDDFIAERNSVWSYRAQFSVIYWLICINTKPKTIYYEMKKKIHIVTLSE